MGFSCWWRWTNRNFVPKLCPEIVREMVMRRRLTAERGVGAAVLHPRREVASETSPEPEEVHRSSERRTPTLAPRRLRPNRLAALGTARLRTSAADHLRTVTTPSKHNRHHCLPADSSVLRLLLRPISPAVPRLLCCPIPGPKPCTPGLAHHFQWGVEEGSPARKRRTPFLESPGVKPNPGQGWGSGLLTS